MTNQIEIEVRVAADVDSDPLPEGVVPVFTTCGAHGKNVPRVAVLGKGCGKAVVYDGADANLPNGDNALTLCLDCSLLLMAGVAQDPNASMAEPVFSEHWGEDEKQLVRNVMAAVTKRKPDTDKEQADAMFRAAQDTASAVKAHYGMVPIPEDEGERHQHMLGGVSALGALMPVLYAATAAGRLPEDDKLVRTLCELVGETVDAMVKLHGVEAPGINSVVAAMEEREGDS